MPFESLKLVFAKMNKIFPPGYVVSPPSLASGEHGPRF